jgi:hypothetical protein
MTDQELRDMVRESIARQLGPLGAAHAPAHAHAPSHHASFALLPLSRGGDGDGACLIEPSVRCNHCGYCLSYGH